MAVGLRVAEYDGRLYLDLCDRERRAVKIGPDEGGATLTYRVTVFYGRPTGGSLKPGGDTEAARWVHLDDVEELPMTPGTADLIWVAAHRMRSA